jgi:hypothetical protein
MKVPNAVGDGAAKDGRVGTVDSPTDSPAIGQARHPRDVDERPALTARAVADGAVATWQSVAVALAPIIGRSAVTVLYRRCLVSVGIDRTWLPSVTAADLPENDWTTLHAAVSRQSAGEASDACASLFVALRDLLGSLIGPSLAEQLLRPVSALPPIGSAAKDTHP